MGLLKEGAMTTTTTESYFTDLGRRGYIPLMEKASGTVRFDLAHDQGTDHWLVGFDKGNIKTMPCAGDASADSVIATDRAVFDRVMTGQMSAMAAMVRGDLTVEGDPELLMLFKRLMPEPSGAQTSQPNLVADRKLS
jgi:putative sterol carrier protein